MPARKALLAALLVLITLSPQLQLILNAKETARNTERRVEAVEVFSIPRVHAQAVTRRPTRVGETAERFFAGAIQVFVLVDWFAVIAVQTLLDPDMIFGRPNKNGVRPMEIRLRRIWVTSRDIVNGIFALLLLFGAISMIVRADDGFGFIKKHIAGFVLAVILVNFSWFFPRVILDISNVLTAVIYRLPAIVAPAGEPICKGPPAGIDGDMETTGDNGKCMYAGRFHFLPPTAEECALSIASSVGGAVGGISIPLLPGCPRPTHGQDAPNKGMVQDDLIAIYYEDWNKVKEDGFNIAGTNVKVGNSDLVINGLVANFTRLPDLARLRFRDFSTAGQNRTVSQQLRAALKFFIHIVFQLILLVAVGLVLLALTGVLIARIAVIWLTVAFMPFIFIGPAMGGSFSALGNLGSQQELNIWKKFIQYAFLPVLVAIPLSIAFALAAQLYYAPGSFKGTLDVVGLENVIPTFTDFRELLWMAIIIGIIWFGTFSVLEGDKIAGSITGFFKGVGGSAARFGKNVAMYAPIAGLPRGVGGAVEDFRRASRDPWATLRPPGDGGTPGGGAPSDSQLRYAAGRLNGTTAAERRTDIEKGLTRPKDRAEWQNATKELGIATVERRGLTKEEFEAVMRNPKKYSTLMREHLKDEGKVRDAEHYYDKYGSGTGADQNKVQFGDSGFNPPVNDYRTKSAKENVEKVRVEIEGLRPGSVSNAQAVAILRDIEKDQVASGYRPQGENLGRFADAMEKTNLNLSDLVNELRKDNSPTLQAKLDRSAIEAMRDLLGGKDSTL